jgi:hypothetical protein
VIQGKRARLCPDLDERCEASSAGSSDPAKGLRCSNVNPDVCIANHKRGACLDLVVLFILFFHA